jgi:hypothetical protein
MQVEAKLRGEGFFVSPEAVVIAALLEGEEENIGHFAAKDAPCHLNVAILRNWYG